MTIQAQILEVIKKGQRETGAAVIMITHDMGVVANVADDVLVMYAGRPVEHAPVDDLFYDTRMPYSIGLLAAIPRVDKKEKQPLVPIKGNPPMLIDLPDACPFADRCRSRSRRAARASLRSRRSRPAVPITARHASAPTRSGPAYIGDEPVYPAPVIPESDLQAVPREERAETLRVENLAKTFPLLKGGLAKRKVGEVHAVKNVSFDVREGETLAIVGESGSGKTTTLLEIMELVEPAGGDIIIGGTSVKDIRSRRHERVLRRDIQIVFQDPMGALDPRMTVFDIIAEPLRTIGVNKVKTHERVDELMSLVGLNPSHGDRFPQAFSGGQRQRIGIARALATEPA